jgi:hypothetical protein
MRHEPWVDHEKFDALYQWLIILERLPLPWEAPLPPEKKIEYQKERLELMRWLFDKKMDPRDKKKYGDRPPHAWFDPDWANPIPLCDGDLLELAEHLGIRVKETPKELEFEHVEPKRGTRVWYHWLLGKYWQYIQVSNKKTPQEKVADAKERLRGEIRMIKSRWGKNKGAPMTKGALNAALRRGEKMFPNGPDLLAAYIPALITADATKSRQRRSVPKPRARARSSRAIAAALNARGVATARGGGKCR